MTCGEGKKEDDGETDWEKEGDNVTNGNTDIQHTYSAYFWSARGWFYEDFRFETPLGLGVKRGRKRGI